MCVDRLVFGLESIAALSAARMCETGQRVRDTPAVISLLEVCCQCRGAFSKVGQELVI